MADLPAFLSCASLQDSDLVPVGLITAVGVWDTVGAMGFPDYVAGGQRVDAFKFADTKLSAKVQHGFHAVALDERRNDFAPTLWDPEDRIVQMLFPGAHGDVGGGYPTENHESGLSDNALMWMLGQLIQIGVRIAAGAADAIHPDASGTAHQPWSHAPWTLPGVPLGPRAFPKTMQADPSVAARRSAGAVVAKPGTAPTLYNPTNLP